MGKKNLSFKQRKLVRGGTILGVKTLLWASATLWSSRWLNSNVGRGSAIGLASFVTVITVAYIVRTEGRLVLLVLQIVRLTSRRDMPRRVKLCREGLALVDRHTQPNEWAMFQNALGFSLSQNPSGNRADNLEQAIYHYQQAQQVWTRQNNPYEWANSYNNLAEAYNNRIRGEPAENIELAISFYEQALEVITRPTYPDEWAKIMNNLGALYNKRIRGERAKNIELAIDYCQQALLIVTRRGFPNESAGCCNNLAEAYRKRIRGERAKNIELAIDYSWQAQQVWTRQVYPYEWATSCNNLGAAYLVRIRGERAQNIELAIDYSWQALEVYTRQDFPENWAKSINNLAQAYYERIKGERSSNIEHAIDYHEQALQVYTRQDFPYEWAISCNNLANALYSRIRGELAQNIELAIDYYQQAQKVYTREAFPYEWATSCNNLAAAYRERIRGKRAQNIEKAIEHHEQALQVYTREAFPYEWARTMNNLAHTLSKPIKGKHAQNIEKAIEHYQQAQKVWTRQAYPFDWASNMSGLSDAYYSRIKGEHTENIEKAIDGLKQVLEVRTPQSFPQDCRDTAYGLGLVLYDKERFAEARQAFVTTHKAVEALRGEVRRDGARRKLASENADLYARLVFCCLHEADEGAAFEYTAAGKGRAFVDMLSSARFDLFAAEAGDPALAADLQAYRELRQQIDNLRTRLTGRGTEIDEQLRKQEWELLRQLQRQELERWEDLTYKYPALTATQSAPSLSVEAAQALATDLGATLVEFVQHAGGWSAFVVTSSAVRHVPLPDVNDEFLQEVKQSWTKIVERLIRDRYYNDEDFYSLEEWYEALIMPLKPHLPLSGKVVLAPAGALHLIPLTIARHPDTLAYLCDEYALSFAPSLAALRVTRQQAKKKSAAKDESLGSLLAVAYPGQSGQPYYLSHAVAESVAIETHFSNVTRLYHKTATPQAVVEKAKGQAVAHFSCHGTFDSDLPSQSGLALSGGYLTVQRIITELRLSDARLATLSACVTHRADLRAGEEHVGLVQSVLTAGAQSVVASLWSVPELATRVLFEQFYHAVANGKAPAQALTEAMRYVRQQPGWEHPFYWAAFQVSGLGYDLQVSA